MVAKYLLREWVVILMPVSLPSCVTESDILDRMTLWRRPSWPRVCRRKSSWRMPCFIADLRYISIASVTGCGTSM